MKIQSTFCLLDVKRGRKKLAKFFNFEAAPEGLRIPVTITGYVTGVWGNDDGESQEFTVEVTKAKLS
jgi:hypothetical protein